MARVRTTADKANRERKKPAALAAVRKAPAPISKAIAAQVPVDKPLTDKQRAYALARGRGESVPNAMAAAGYNEQPSYGYRMEHMPNIRALIQQEQALYAESAQITRKKVVDMHLEAYEMARTMAEPATMVAAAREVGKICGLYEPKKVEISVDGTISHELRRMEGLTDAELIEILHRGMVAAHEKAPLALETSDDRP